MSLIDSNTDLIYVFKRTGTSENPFLDIEENITINFDRIFLKEVPEVFNRVVILEGSNRYNEVENRMNIKNPTDYFVDYQSGTVYFQTALNNKNLKFKYKGRGVVLYPASRIYTSISGNAIETMQDAIDGTLSSATEANKLVETVSKSLLEANSQISNIKTQSDYAKNQGDYAKTQGESLNAIRESTVLATQNTNKATDNANKVTADMNKKITETNSVIESVNSAISETNEAKTNTENATAKANTISDNLVHKDEYDSTVTYQPRNIVSYEGSSYMNIESSTGVLPTDKAKWLLVSFKGDKGDKGETGNTGIQGIQGNKGDKGDTGIQGEKGDKGETGERGETGLKGDKGDKGDTGERGSDVEYHWMTLDAQTIRKGIDGVLTPANITMTGFKQIGNGDPVEYAGRHIIYESIDGITFESAFIGTVNSSRRTYALTNPEIKAVRVRFYKADGTDVLLDEKTVPIVKDGATGERGERGEKGEKGEDGAGNILSVNGKTGEVILNASDIGALSVDTIIPTKTSELTNDGNFETVEGSKEKSKRVLEDSKVYTDEKVAEIVNSAPETLDTLNELSKALGDDPNFATTVSNEIGSKETPEGAQEKADKVLVDSKAYTDNKTSETLNTAKDYTDTMLESVKGSTTLVQYAYTLTATEDSQNNFTIPLETFDKNNDVLNVSLNRNVLDNTDYNISERTLVLKDVSEVSIGSTLFIQILKNIPLGEVETISGANLEDDSVSLSKLEPDIRGTIENVKGISEKSDIVDEKIFDLEQSLTEHKSDYVKHLAFAVATGTANNYLVSLDSAPEKYINGMGIVVAINVDSTAKSTLNVNGLGAKSIKKANGNDVINLKANGVYTFRYMAGNFILQGEGASGNALASDLLSGKTASTDAGDLVGTMPNKVGSRTIFTPRTSDIVIPKGYFGGNTNDGKILGDLNLIADNILSGKSIFGVNGNLTPKRVASGSATSSAQYDLTVSLSFKPSVVVFSAYNGTSYYNLGVLFDYKTFYTLLNQSYKAINGFSLVQMWGENPNQLGLLNEETSYVLDNGFKIKIPYSSTRYDFKAIEY